MVLRYAFPEVLRNNADHARPWNRDPRFQSAGLAKCAWKHQSTCHKPDAQKARKLPSFLARSRSPKHCKWVSTLRARLTQRLYHLVRNAARVFLEPLDFDMPRGPRCKYGSTRAPAIAVDNPEDRNPIVFTAAWNLSVFTTQLNLRIHGYPYFSMRKGVPLAV